MITASSPIVGKGGTVDEALAALDTPDATDAEYVGTLFRLCAETGLDYRIAFGQFCVETANGTSPRWLTNRNPAGLGIVADGDPDPGTFDGTEAASVHVRALHMAAIDSNIVDNPVTPASADAFFARWYKKITDPSYPRDVIRIVSDLCRHYTDASGEQQSTWAWDRTYADQICAKANVIFKDTGGTTMGLYAVAGLATKIELPVPLVQAIIPAGQTNQRPGIKLSTPLYWTQHETANTANGADAAMHARYLLNGGNGGQVSWHFTVDDHQIYQHIPIDEVTWQAADGGGPGNMNSISCEMAVNADGDEATARHNTEALAAAICRAKGIPVANVKRHYDWNAGTADRHHCPDHMMNQNYWPTFVANVGALIAGGTAVAEPFAITWEPGAVGVQTIGETKALALLGEVTAKRALPLRQSVSSTSPVVHTLKAGEKATIVGTYRDPKTSRRWAFIKFADGKYGRCLLSAVTPSFPTL